MAYHLLGATSAKESRLMRAYLNISYLVNLRKHSKAQMRYGCWEEGHQQARERSMGRELIRTEYINATIKHISLYYNFKRLL